MNLTHLKAHVMRHAPLNLDALQLAQNNTEAIVVTTSFEEGIPQYVTPEGREWLDAKQVNRREVEVIRCVLGEDIALDMQKEICNAGAIYLNLLD